MTPEKYKEVKALQSHALADIATAAKLHKEAVALYKRSKKAAFQLVSWDDYEARLKENGTPNVSENPIVAHPETWLTTCSRLRFGKLCIGEGEYDQQFIKGMDILVNFYESWDE